MSVASSDRREALEACPRPGRPQQKDLVLMLPLRGVMVLIPAVSGAGETTRCSCLAWA